MSITNEPKVVATRKEQVSERASHSYIGVHCFNTMKYMLRESDTHLVTTAQFAGIMC